MIGYPISWITEIFLTESGGQLGEQVFVFAMAKNIIGTGIDHDQKL